MITIETPKINNKSGSGLGMLIFILIITGATILGIREGIVPNPFKNIKKDEE